MATGAKRGLRQALFGAAIIGIFAALTALVVRASRPHWRTYTFPADPKSGLAVAIDYPDNLHLSKSFPNSGPFGPLIQIQLDPKPPTGLARWWLEKVMHEHVTTGSTATGLPNGAVMVNVLSGPLYKDMATTEKSWTRVPSGAKFRFDQVRHTLGPALATTAIIDFKRMRVRLGGQTLPPVMQIHGITIFPDLPVGATRITISIIGIGPTAGYWRTGNAVDGMIQRVRLVRTTTSAVGHP